jgi:hypothetical protein
MQIIEMVLVIQFVAQRMLPKSPLPDAAPPVAETGSRHRLFGTAQGQPILREVFFDDAPAFRIIAVIWRQCPDGVNMIGQYHQRIDAKRQMLLAVTNRISQTISRRIICQNSRPPFRHHRKEIRSTRYITATIIGHHNLRLGTHHAPWLIFCGGANPQKHEIHIKQQELLFGNFCRVRTAYHFANIFDWLNPKRYAVRTLVSLLPPWLATLALRQKELVRTLKA